LSGTDTGAEEPAPAPVTADAPGAARADAGMGTLTGPRPARPGPATASSPPRLPDRVLGWLMVGVPALAGLVAGGYKIGYAPLWRDEASTKAVAGRSVGQILALLHHTDAVHGAYYLVMHVAVGILGTTAGALRLPSLAAMSVACAFTAAIGYRLAVAAAAPLARFTGLCAGLVLATSPYMIRYAQEARSYAIVTMFATIATYFLLRALWDGRRWWVAYGVAVAVCGLFNIFGLLILAAHGLSLAIAGARQRAAVARTAVTLTKGNRRRGAHASDLSALAPAGLTGRRVAGLPRRWLIAGAVSVLVLVPLGVVAFGQRGQISWMTRPHFRAIVALAYNSAGSWRLITPIFALAVGGVLAELFIDRGRRPLTPGVVAFPWMVAPPAILIAVSAIHPIYDERYVEYCLPALAILVAWGIAWIARLATATPLGQTGLGWLPSAIVILGLLALLVTPDKVVRLDYARPDNLVAASTIVRHHEKPGDIIFYIPANGRIIAMPYPGPFNKLRDIALAASPLASATISGTEVSASVLHSRFVHVTRVWTVMGITVGGNTGAVTATDEEKLDLVWGMRRIGQWWDGDTVLSLYAKR
jgi:mannosyltransferase